MKRITLILTPILTPFLISILASFSALLLMPLAASAQEDNLHYQWLDDFARNIGTYSPHCYNPRRVPVPDIPGYHTYKADLHMHTFYSDASVSPEERVMEAWYEDLDILAITDHHPAPRRRFAKENLNESYELAAKTAEQLDFKLIKGFEITDGEPVGHINVLFVKDLSHYRMTSNTDTTEAADIIRMALAEDAIVFANHPGWPDENSDLTPFVRSRMADGTFCGVEVFNHKEFYPLAIDYANEYHLSMMANTDSHHPTWMQFDMEDNHRDMTLIFAKDKSDEALKEALRAGRTIAWADNILAGPEPLMRSFFRACIQPVFVKDEGAFVRFRVLNTSDIPFFLVGPRPQETIRIPAQGYAEMKRRKTTLNESYQVMNTYVGAATHLEVSLASLMEDNTTVAAPFISDSSINFSSEGAKFRFSTGEGYTYYTLDGSDPIIYNPTPGLTPGLTPDQTTSAKPSAGAASSAGAAADAASENVTVMTNAPIISVTSTLYKGDDIVLKSPATIKAVTVADNGAVSKVFERRLPFSTAIKFKPRKHGVSYRYFEHPDILSTNDLETIGVQMETGTYLQPNIDEAAGLDHFGYIFTGIIKVPATGMYTFILSTNDGSDMFIGSELACDNDQHNGVSTSKGSIYLEEGCHPFTIRYFEGYGGESFSLSWVLPGEKNAVPVPADVFYLDTRK